MFEQIDAEISEDQAKLLATIHAAEEGIPTGRLREAVSIPSGSMHYHLTRLEDWDLVDVVGRQEEGGGSPSKVWETTERGAIYLERPGRTAPTTFQDLLTHIDDLERDLDRGDDTDRTSRRRARYKPALCLRRQDRCATGSTLAPCLGLLVQLSLNSERIPSSS
ncbi:helix-turn-helix domain-containing protein [Halomarina pelagica]|uniref:helix-turn-helix domain-containing protein n=1 Tax=Halomarina pelagica TaxID=2961599 RepID=UPI0020C1E0C1|nr:helix-turn-helix domain-containing protein [Halomarina sp. BND7]